MQNAFNNWKHLRGEINSAWELLGEEDLNGVDGRDVLVNLLATRYGLAKGRAEREVDRLVTAFEAKLRKAA